MAKKKVRGRLKVEEKVPDFVARVKMLLAERDRWGRKKYTVDQIAKMFGV